MPTTTPNADQQRFSRAFLVLLLVFVSVLFVHMIRGFLLTVLLAAIFSGLTSPLYRRLERWFGGRRAPAAAVSLALVVVVIVTPVLLFLGVVASEALTVGQSVGPWVSEQLRRPTALDSLLERFPFLKALEPYRNQVLERLGELAARISRFLVDSLSVATRGTVGFLLHFFIMIYAMFFFLIDGRTMLGQLTAYLPLPEDDKRLILDKFVSVSRATLKGTLVVGTIQGGLSGVAFAVAGIDGAAFWGTVMAVLSILPGIGGALIWVPAVGYLLVVGRITAAVGLLLWCGLLVGTVDNVLRPLLVGKDTRMPDLLIMLSTLGGISVFGAVGFVIGPVVAALFLTVWQIYGVAFEHLLSARAPAAAASAGPPED